MTREWQLAGHVIELRNLLFNRVSLPLRTADLSVVGATRIDLYARALNRSIRCFPSLPGAADP
jgi:hypothetical protein